MLRLMVDSNDLNYKITDDERRNTGLSRFRRVRKIQPYDCSIRLIAIPHIRSNLDNSLVWNLSV